MVWQMEPQRGESQPPGWRHRISRAGGEGWAKEGADERLPKTGQAGRPLASHPPLLSALAIQLPFRRLP